MSKKENEVRYMIEFTGNELHVKGLALCIAEIIEKLDKIEKHLHSPKSE